MLIYFTSITNLKKTLNQFTAFKLTKDFLISTIESNQLIKQNQPSDMLHLWKNKLDLLSTIW